MGVYISGMEMPTSCGYCPLRHEARDGDECYLGASLTEYQKRPEDCPLVPVPEHGRLGDLDKLENSLRHMAKYQYGERQQGILGCCETIRSAPAVISAEEG